jgi:effector-binding domain-containing protein
MRIISILCFGYLVSSFSLFGQEKKSTFEVSIRNVDKIQMVYYEFTGPYDQSFNEFGNLIAFIQQNNVQLEAFSLGIFLDDPEVVPGNELRSKIGHAIGSNPDFKSDTYKFKEIPAGKAVSVRYKSMEEIMPAYQAISKYIMDNNLKTEPYSVELYFGQDPNTLDAEILFYLKN